MQQFVVSFIGGALCALVPAWLWLDARQDRDAWHSAALIKELELKFLCRKLRAYGPAGEVAKRHGCTCREVQMDSGLEMLTAMGSPITENHVVDLHDETRRYYALDPNCTFHLYDPAMKETGYQYLNAYTRTGKDRRA